MNVSDDLSNDGLSHQVTKVIDACNLVPNDSFQLLKKNSSTGQQALRTPFSPSVDIFFSSMFDTLIS